MDANRIYGDLGRRIKDLRKGLGRTQDQLAKQVGISRASLANIEAGRQQVLVHYLFGLASALELESPATLLLPPRVNAQARRGASQLPLSSAGLTEKQRRDILKLMDDALSTNNDNEGRGDE